MFIIDSELTSNTQIIMALPQTILYNLQLPEFINNFKQACISRLLPPLDQGIEFLKTTNSPILIVLLIVLFVQLIRIAITQFRNSKKNQPISEQPDNRGASREIKDLKRQLKAMQKTVQQLKQNGLGKSSISSRQTVISNQSTRQIISSCKESWVKREEIALHLIEYQTMLMNEVRELKRSNSRISSPLKSNNTIPISTSSNAKNAKAPASLPLFKNQTRKQSSQIKKPEVERVQPVSKVPKVEIPPKRKEVPQAPKKIIENRKQPVKQIPTQQIPVQQLPVFEDQSFNQIVSNGLQQKTEPIPQQNQPQLNMNDANHVLNQQTKLKQQVTIPSNNTQIQQGLKFEQPPVVIEDAPRPMPPLPKQAPAVGRRPPGPPQKGERKNPPPPPVRKM